MKKKTYLNALDKVECRDDFRQKVENILSESSGEYADSVSHVEVANPRKLRRVFTGALACVTVLSVIGVSYKMFENAPDIPDENTISESSSIPQSEADLIQPASPLENFLETQFDFEIFSITDDERRQIAELLNNKIVYKDFKESNDIPDSQWDMPALNFTYTSDMESMDINIFPNDRLSYKYREPSGNEKSISCPINYKSFRTEIFKILNINNFDNFNYARVDIAEPLRKIELNGEELEIEKFNSFISNGKHEWATVENTPDLTNASVVNELCVKFESSELILREYDNGYIESCETRFFEGEVTGSDSRNNFYRSRFFENLEIFTDNQNLPFADFAEIGYNFVYFDITDDERQNLAEFFNNYKWIETDDDSWGIVNMDDMNSDKIEFKYIDGDDKPNCFVEFLKNGFMVYNYLETFEDYIYKTKAYKIDYDYFRNGIFSILNIKDSFTDVMIFDNKESVSEISLNGNMLEGKERDALIEYFAINKCRLWEINNTPDLSTANVINEIEYTDTDGVSHKITAYDNGYADIDGVYYRTNAFNFTMDYIIEIYDGFQSEPYDGFTKLMKHADSPIVCTKAEFEKALRLANENYKHGVKYIIDADYYAENFDSMEEDRKKDFVYCMMLNSVDYYDTAEGKINYNTSDGFYSIEYNMNLNDDYYHWIHSSNGEWGDTADREYFIYDGIRYDVDLIEKSYSSSEVPEPKEYTRLYNERIALVDGEKQIFYRGNNLDCAGELSLFPQALAFRYLQNFSKWNISGTENYAGRECIVIDGIVTDDGNNKWFENYIDNPDLYNESTDFKMRVDKNTGILLSYAFSSDEKGVIADMRTEYINIDTPVECEEFNSEGYTD